MRKNILYAILFCGATAGLVGWRTHALRNHDTPHFEIVEDLSLSHSGGCESLLGIAERVLGSNGVSSNSTLTVLVIGDESTANEPWELGRYSIPRTQKALEGRAATVRRQQTMLSDIRKKCEAPPRTTISPIFLGVRQAIADLRAQGCKETSHCEMFVDSDLEENVELSIKRSLQSADYSKHHLPLSVDNSGISVKLCGIAVTTGHISPSGREVNGTLSRNGSREDSLRRIWLSLFTEPDLVAFEPYCPNAHSPT